MTIFDKRPLSLILCMLLGGFVFFSISDRSWRIALVSIGVLLLGFAIFALAKGFKGRILTVICAIALLLGSALSLLYSNLHFINDEDFDEKAEIIGVITEEDAYSYSKRLVIKIEKINGEKRTGCSVIAFPTFAESENISEGSRIKIVGNISSFDSATDTDSAASYRASGYSAMIVDIESIEYVEYAGVTLKSRIESYRDALCRRIIMHSDRESGGLLCALLLGERDYLSGELRHDFARLGISHMLALSGMHLAILSFAIEMILSKFGVMKKPRKIIQIVFVTLYMLLVGLPSSVMRAGIMLIITSLLFLLSHRADSITNLFIAVTVILVIEPYAVYDVGLWLSVFATLGILVFIEFYEREREKGKKTTVKRKLFNILALPVLISVFAFGATFLLNVSTFKSFSLLALIATPIYGIVIELYMYLGILLLILGRLFSFGSFVKVCGDLITSTVRGVSSIKWIYNVAEHPEITIILIVFTVAFIAFAVLDIKRKRSAVALLSGMIAVAFVISLLMSLYAKGGDSFEYSLNGSNEWIVMQDEGTVALLDITSASSKTTSQEIDHLHDMGLTTLDYYVFTSYSSKTASSIDKLLGSLYISDIYLPLPQNEDELAIAEKIITSNKKSKSEFHFYKSDEFIHCGEFDIFPAYRSQDANKMALTIHYRDNFYTYLSSGMLENDTKNVALPLIDGCNTLILGRHGNSYSNYKFIYQVEGLDRLIASSKNLTLPSETQRYYNGIGTDIRYSPECLELYVE